MLANAVHGSHQLSFHLLYFGPQAHAFFRELGRRIKEETGEPLSLHYLHQRITVAIQRGNAAAVLGTSPPGDTDPIFIR